MNSKPITPYARLLTDIKEFCKKLQFRHKKEMWYYEKNSINSSTASFKLSDLFERVAAAEQLGYDVVLEANSKKGLVVWYVKKPPMIPLEWQ